MRRFNKRQRSALAFLSNGLCSICSVKLDQGFHADHVIPYSKNGKTDVINGQALCPKCNLKKGNKMTNIKLRDWQKKAKNEAVEKLAGENFFLLQATPGGGKTICALAIFDELKRAGKVNRLIVVAPSTTLVKQWQEDALKLFKYDLSVNIIHPTMADYHLYSGMVMTYQGMNEVTETLRALTARDKTMVIADEMHHVADGKSWGDSFQNAFEPCENILGLTGTPWASNGQKIPFVSYGEDGLAVCDFEYQKKHAVRDWVTRIVEFIGYEPNGLQFTNKRTGEDMGKFETIESASECGVKGAYLKTLRNLTHMKRLFLDADENLKTIRASGIPDAGGLIVAPDIATAHNYQDEIFALTGIEFPIVHSKVSKPHELINDFKNSTERWIISVDMVTEGVDIKRLQVCVFLSNKNTELFLRQVIGRIERIRVGIKATQDYLPHHPEHQRAILDRSASFYYTKEAELAEIIAKIDSENKAGAKLSECKKCKQSPCVCEREEMGSKERLEDETELTDIENNLAELRANGFEFPQIVVAEALKMRREFEITRDIPLYQVCKMVMVTTGTAQKTEQSNENEAVPMDEIKKRMKARINKSLIRKLTIHLSRKPQGSDIATAHYKINHAVGISRTDDTTPMEKLEAKLAYITKMDAKQWV